MDASGSHGHVKGKGNQNIQVYLRVRPLSSREQSQRTIQVVDVPSARDVHVRQTYDSKNSKKFTFDRVFGTDSKQKDVYSSVVAPFIGEVLSGYNCTVFAYGQTGTGKTYTMVGDDTSEIRTSWDDDCPMGIIPRAVVHLFDELRMMDVEFSMRISYLELYNEELCDLLGTDDTVKIRIYDDSSKKGSVIVQGLEEIPVHNKEDVYKLLSKGQERRKTAATLMNAQSSRSHTVFSILVHIKENGLDGEDMLKIGKLNLVDLAGSENITKAGNEKGIRTRETVNINQSLLTLGRVITALVERQPHVPYRESKLTRLLQESLGGRTKTSIIATISPGSRDSEETLNTLDYAHRAKNIQNRPEINQRLTKKTVLKDYTEEIDRLKRDLNAAREKNGVYLPDDEYNDIIYKMDCQTKELNEKMLTIRAIKGEMEKKENMFDEVQRNLHQKTRELMATSENLNRTNLVLRDTKETLRVVEQRYEESTHLVQVHQDTEKVLAGQAKALIEVADEASKDTYGLHEAIQRRKNVDVTIHRTVETFGNDLNGDLDKMKESVKSHYGEMCAKTVEIENEMENSKKRSNTFADELREKIQKIDHKNSEFSEESLQIFRDFRSNLLTGSDANCAHVVQMLNAAVQKQKEYRDDVENFVKEMRAMEEKCEQNTTNFSNRMQSFQKNIREDADTFVAVCRDYLNQIKEHNDVTLRERNETMLKHIEDNKRRMVQLADLTKQLTEGMKAVEMNNDTLETHLKHNSADRSAFAEKLSENNHHVSDFHENLLNDLVTVGADCQSADAQAATLSEERRKIVAKMCDKTKENTDYMCENASNIAKELETKKGQMELDVEEVSRKMDKCHGESTQEVHSVSLETLNKIMKNLIDAVVSDKKVHLYSDATRDAALAFKDSTCDTIQMMQANIENLYTTDLKTYTSTGETPIRKEFKYNRNLAATSPHERIVNRFRENLRATDISSLLEVREETSGEQENMDVDTGTPLVMSTPIHSTANDRSLRELNVEKIVAAAGKKRDVRDCTGDLPSFPEVSSDKE